MLDAVLTSTNMTGTYTDKLGIRYGRASKAAGTVSVKKDVHQAAPGM